MPDNKTAANQIVCTPIAEKFMEERRGVPVMVDINTLDLYSSTGGEQKPYAVVNGVGIVDICGCLTMDDPWYGTTYGYIQECIDRCVDDPAVQGILLRVNSPGGETDGLFETAAAIEAAGQRKTTWALVDMNAYSAAYLLASSASRIVAPPQSGGVGSIGVYAVHADVSKALDQAGVKITLISAGTGKTDANQFEPLSDSARTNLQAEVDRLYGLFADYVGRRRKMGSDAVRKMGAALFHGAGNAITAGLADAQGTLEDVISEFTARIGASKSPGGGMYGSHVAESVTTLSKEGNMPEIQTDPQPAAAAPVSIDNARLVAEARTDGYNVAADIVELCAIAGTPQLASGFIRDRKPISEVRKALIDARAKAGGEEIGGHIEPHAGMKISQAGENSPVFKACQKIAAEMQMRFKGGR